MTNDTNIDYRTLKLKMTRGELTQEEYDKYLKDLPDLSSQFDEIPAYEEPEMDIEDPADLTFSV